MSDQVYDAESYPNFFCVGFLPIDGDRGSQFEISDRVNQSAELWNFLRFFKGRLIGFFSQGYDWPLLTAFINGARTAPELWDETQRLFALPEFERIIWKPMIEQIDLAKIWHFDNRAKATSLKALQFAMRSRSIEDLPYAPGTRLTSDQMNVVLHYNAHDITETKKFAGHSREAIEFRDSIGPHSLCWSDTKIGERYFIEKLEAAGVQCYENLPNGRRAARWTEHENGVALADVVFPWIQFRRPELAEILADVKAQRIYETKGTYERVVKLDGFEFKIGLGGIHGSIHRKIVEGQNTLDIDVTGYYPALAIHHRFHPAHLGPVFCDVAGELRDSRAKYAKGTATNTTIKLAGNSVFGKSNSEHSPMFDTAHMLRTTINGQLLQCMVAEALLAIPGVRLIQMNTDGLTIQYPDEAKSSIEAILDWWESVTGMNLEPVLYRRMFIRDVNNYISEGVDGKRKRKGAYEHDREWWQNHSALIVPKAVEAFMLDDIDPEDFVRNHADPFDFLLLAKAPRGSRLELGESGPIQRITRYYVSTDGEQLVKVMPPLPGKTGERRSVIHAEGRAQIAGARGAWSCSSCGSTFRTKGEANLHNRREHSWKVTPCNVFDGDLSGLDLGYYLAEIEKLIITERF